MQKLSLQNITKKVSFIGKNPQLVYTIFLLIVIPMAFLVSSQKFLNVVTDHQERLEKDRIGLMQDVFVEFALPYLQDPDFLQKRIEGIVKINETITDFKVMERVGGEYRILASLNKDEIGKIDQDSDRNFYYDYSFAQDDSSVIFPGYEQGERRWRAVRPILDESKNVSGMIYTDVSMAHIDAILTRNIKSAYSFLIFIIVIIGVLLIHQAKVIDYAILYKRLKEVDQMKDDFIGMAAHELRTPLTIIRGYTEMLTDSKRLTESDRQLTANIEASASHLNQMIADILDVSRLQQGRLSFKLQEITPSNLIEEVVESLKYTAEQKGLNLLYEKKEAALVSIDPDRLKQILINTIGNAVKYTPEGSVTVTTYVEKDKLYIRVSDTGIGISAEEQKKLFTRFYRVKSKETDSIRGTGLGLWITKNIINQMSGNISVESIKGKGTDFIISFPVVQAKV